MNKDSRKSIKLLTQRRSVFTKGLKEAKTGKGLRQPLFSPKYTLHYVNLYVYIY